MTYLEMAKRARAELRKKRSNEMTPAEQTPSFVTSFRSSSVSYAHPWPDALPGLGPRTIGPFDACAGCERWSWARYGRVVLCLACARAKAQP